jgi:hypothetical protein
MQRPRIPGYLSNLLQKCSAGSKDVPAGEHALRLPVFVALEAAGADADAGGIGELRHDVRGPAVAAVAAVAVRVETLVGSGRSLALRRGWMRGRRWKGEGCAAQGGGVNIGSARMKMRRIRRETYQCLRILAALPGVRLYAAGGGL